MYFRNIFSVISVTYISIISAFSFTTFNVCLDYNDSPSKFIELTSKCPILKELNDYLSQIDVKIGNLNTEYKLNKVLYCYAEKK